jgi:hypothetical protein
MPSRSAQLEHTLVRLPHQCDAQRVSFTLHCVYVATLGSNQATQPEILLFLSYCCCCFPRLAPELLKGLHKKIALSHH